MLLAARDGIDVAHGYVRLVVQAPQAACQRLHTLLHPCVRNLEYHLIFCFCFSILGYNLWAQLYALAAMCRVPFLCSQDRFLPVAAPPVAFRVSGPAARFYRGVGTKAEETCRPADGSACKEPGARLAVKSRG